MFGLCHFKDDSNSFILFDDKDFKEVAEQLHIEIEKELSFEELEKDYSEIPILAVNDLLLRSMVGRHRTTTHVLDELGISCWNAIKEEYDKIMEKKSCLSRSQRERLLAHYNHIKA